MAAEERRVSRVTVRLASQAVFRSRVQHQVGDVVDWQSQNGHQKQPPEQRPLLREKAPPRPLPPATRQRHQRSLHLRQERVYKLGEPGSGLRGRGEIQDFYKLREKCLERGELFEDPQFPAQDSSLFFGKKTHRHIKWLRPKEIVSNPHLFVEGASRFDVKQGEIGDCWFLAAVANLTLNEHLFSRVIPHDQSFRNKYAGIFHFRFWQYGRWVDVVIDDRLPTYAGKLIYLHSSTYNEFWSCLLEKAYAKLYGSYEALISGVTTEAMEDFTGGVTEMFELNQPPHNMYKIMLKAYERGALMGCSIEADQNVPEAKTPEGLIRGHAYSVTKVRYVNVSTPRKTGVIPLVRVRNPWGDDSEWNGAWSDRSQEWKLISESEKQSMDLTFKADGEFWMSYTDFKRYFSRIEICNWSSEIIEEETGKKWEMSMFEGEWVRGVTAGGCRDFKETFAYNPQYRITLVDPDEDDDDDQCTVIIALMQKNRRLQKKMGAESLSIGFAVYHLPEPDRLPKPLDTNFLLRKKSAAMSYFANLREVTHRCKLPPGAYCIIPSTYSPNEEGEFLLRVFSEHRNNMEENDEDVGLNDTPNSETIGLQNKDVSQEKKIKEFFSKIAGDDMEVDWMELKQLLDFAMEDNLPNASTQIQESAPSLSSLLCVAACCGSSEIKLHDNRGFSKEICRSMIAMKDNDRSGKLSYEEFISLWKDVRLWRNIFQNHDKLNTGQLNAFELRQALHTAGYRVNSHILNVLMHRYGTKNGKIAFDDFMLCAIKLKTMIDIFRKRDSDATQNATFSFEEWIETTLYS